MMNASVCIEEEREREIYHFPKEMFSFGAVFFTVVKMCYIVVAMVSSDVDDIHFRSSSLSPKFNSSNGPISTSSFHPISSMRRSYLQSAAVRGPNWDERRFGCPPYRPYHYRQFH